MNKPPFNDDDFLTQFRRQPRPEFERRLYEKLSQQGVKPMLSVSNLTQDAGLHPPPPTRRLDQRLTLVAAVLTVVILGSLIITLHRPSNNQLPLLVAPTGQEITADTALQVTRLATLGQGYLMGVKWSPDGNWLALEGSVGIWLVHPDDLSHPVSLIQYETNSTWAHARFLPDNQTLLIADLDTVRLWDLNAQTEIQTSIPAERLLSAAISPDGNTLAIGDFEGHLDFYDIHSGEHKGHFTVSYSYTAIMQVVFSPDGKKLAFGGTSTPVLMLEDPTGTWTNIPDEPVMFHPSVQSEVGIGTINFSPDSSRLAARVWTNIFIWDVATGEQITVLDVTRPDADGEHSQVTATPTTEPSSGNLYGYQVSSGDASGVIGKGGGGDLTFSPDGTQVATVDSAVRLWNLDTGAGHTLLPGRQAAYIGQAAFSPDWSRLILVEEDGMLRLLDVKTGAELERVEQYTVNSLFDLAFNASSDHLAARSDQDIYLWDLSDLTTADASRSRWEKETHDPYPALHLAYAPKGDQLAFQSGNQVQLWDMKTGTQRLVLENIDNSLPGMSISSFLVYSPDATLVASASTDGSEALIWETTAGKLVQRLVMPTGQIIQEAVFSADSRHLAVAVGAGLNFGPTTNQTQATASIHIWQVDTGEIVTVLDTFAAPINTLAYTPDGNLLATGSADGRVQLWDAQTGKLARVVEEGNPVGKLAFSPDGTLLVTAEFDNVSQTNVLHLWSMTSPSEKPLIALDNPLGSTDLAFSPDGRMLAASQSNGTIDLWGLPSP